MSDIEDRTIRGKFPCPWCGENNDAATNLKRDDPVPPKPGDFALCMSCAKPSVYQEHGKPRKPTEAEWAHLNADPGITLTRKAIFMSNRGNVSYRDLEVRVTGDQETP